ncbi:glucose-1-phosphate cytidylyltransferase [Ligilactobacillus sp. WC1T17]|uniref:Glucose-1-phosphate cytidylyltransferase n=1 Tax=Ligilactobacillus ruminis TaxID=1623 RepID=A0ABY1ADU0_9LACO|nr:glucose-1-phosphate cytidylyltransferase [Ligilactobacillus ruminis]
MKVVILAGGFGTRISEESQFKPKPMVEIGGKPILWHIMKEYLHYGFDDFIICAGYKQDVIKRYFANYYLENSDVSFDFRNEEKKVIYHSNAEKWKVTVIDTGLNTMTGGRLKRIQPYIGAEPFMMTYGDGVCDVPLDKLLEFHQSQGKMVTITAVKPEGRFGILDLEGNQIESFREKSQDDVGYINGGYMVLEPEIFDYIAGDATTFEREPLERVAAEGQLMAFKHSGFWQCMDTMRDRKKLETLLAQNKAPWKVWED